ncbi:MAG TPA: response regulator [Fimbriiglobus sp.]|jgi:CheY-like chemotaxis protein|nr:response regulator [Fimbriiglobus sp.]
MDIPINPPLRVLCVDDYHDSADSMAMLLEMLGCEVEVSYGGAAALALADVFRPDVCLLDINMPGMDGCELARQLRQHLAGRRLLLVAMTALGSESHRGLTADAGFDLHLTKPVEISALTAALKRFAGGGSRTHWVPDAMRTGA